MPLVQIPSHWNRLLLALAHHQARYVVVGGYAMAGLGRPRSTDDFDILVEPTEENAKRVHAALASLGFGRQVGIEWLSTPYHPIGMRFGATGKTFDIMTCIDGLTFAEVWKGREPAVFVGIRTADFEAVESSLAVSVIGRRDFLVNKSITACKPGRERDRADVETLRALIELSAP